MTLYYIWITGRENPIEIPADQVTWKDEKTYRFNQYIKDDAGNIRKDKDGDPIYKTVAVFGINVTAGFSWAEQTAQY
jgi:hypothetical protein